MGAYSRGRLSDIPVSRVCAYSRGSLIEALWYLFFPRPHNLGLMGNGWIHVE